jgi:hypothetical protein
MALPSTRQQLIEFCLRRLGEPVVEVNIDVDQVEDKIDDTLQMYREYHSDATLRTYMKHLVTPEDVTNGYVPIPADVVFVSRLFPLTGISDVSTGMFNVKYQMMLNNMGDFISWAGDMAYFYQMEQYLGMIDMQLTGTPQTNFSRHQDRLYIYGEWQNGDIQAGDYLAIEIYQVIDPDLHGSIYNDMFIKNYATASIKQQWGLNMLKFDGIQLPGGVTVNGRQLYEEATQELVQLEEKLRLEQELPIDFQIG